MGGVKKNLQKKNLTWNRWRWHHWLQWEPCTRQGKGIWRASRKAPGSEVDDLLSLLYRRQAYPAGDEVSEVLDDGEEGKDDPVGEPLRVIVLHRALEGLDGAVGWVEETHGVGQQLKKEEFQTSILFPRTQREDEPTWAPNPKASQRTMMPASP